MPPITKILFFVSSFFLVYGLVAALSWHENNELAKYSLVAFFVAPFLYIVVENFTAKSQEIPLKINSVSSKNENVMMYIIAYLPPFFSVDYSETGHIIGILGFYAIFFLIYVRLGMFYLNPLFIIRGFRALNITNGSGDTFTALCKSNLRLSSGDEIRYKSAGDFIIVIGEVAENDE